MLIANIKNMKLFFADYIKHDGDWGTKDLKAFHEAFKKALQYTSTMRSVNSAMNLVDKTIHGHGIEEIVGFQNSHTKTVGMYVNMGESYASTIIYDCLANKFYVGTWADWMEWRKKNEDYGLENE
jgi:hypothetical protein